MQLKHKVAVVTGGREPRLVHAVSLGRSHALHGVPPA